MGGQKVRRFRGIAARRTLGRVTIPLPFDPAEVWGRRDRYHVSGTIEGLGFRTTLVHHDIWQLVFGPKSGSAARLADRQTVEVEVWPEGPQQEQLARTLLRHWRLGLRRGWRSIRSRPSIGRVGYGGSMQPSGARRCGPRGSPRWCRWSRQATKNGLDRRSEETLSRLRGAVSSHVRDQPAFLAAGRDFCISDRRPWYPSRH